MSLAPLPKSEVVAVYLPVKLTMTWPADAEEKLTLGYAIAQPMFEYATWSLALASSVTAVAAM